MLRLIAPVSYKLSKRKVASAGSYSDKRGAPRPALGEVMASERSRNKGVNTLYFFYIFPEQFKDSFELTSLRLRRHCKFCNYLGKLT